VPTVKFGGGITVWGCFSWNELGPFIILSGNVNMEGYKNTLSRCILSTIEQFDDDDCLYRHDIAPCHKARSVREWFVDRKNGLPFCQRCSDIWQKVSPAEFELS
jgi:hypothetical protein